MILALVDGLKRQADASSCDLQFEPNGDVMYHAFLLEITPFLIFGACGRHVVVYLLQITMEPVLALHKCAVARLPSVQVGQQYYVQ